MNELVSVIVISYKKLEYIKDTIDSILCQTYGNIELIIADDGTKDFPIEQYKNYIIENNKGNIKEILVYSNNDNLGTVKNLNCAIKKSSGKYVKTIAADDVLYSKDTIEELIKYVEEKSINVLASNMVVCDEKMKLVKNTINKDLFNNTLRISRGNTNKLYKMLCLGNDIPAPTILFRKETLEKHNYYDESYKLMEDWPMWLKLTRNGEKIDYLDIISVKYRFGVGVSNTPNPMYLDDIDLCYEKEIFKYRKVIGLRTYRKAKLNYIRDYKYKKFSLIEKVIFRFQYIDYYFINVLRNIKSKMKII